MFCMSPAKCVEKTFIVVSFLLPTVYVICPSFCLSTPRGCTPARSRRGGTPARSSWEYPTLGTPRQTWMGGTPPWVPPIRPGWGGTPYHTWPGSTLAGGTPCWVPPIGPGWGSTLTGGTLAGGYPNSGNPPRQTWPGGYPDRGGVPHLVQYNRFST